jgi:UDP-glucose 4-epimerase
MPRIGLTYLSTGGAIYGNPDRVPVKEDATCDPITSYGIIKLAAEKYIGMYAELYGIAARILRVGNAYGPFQPAGGSQGIVGTMLAALRNGTPVQVFGDGMMVRDYIHVSDVAYAAVELARCPEGPGVVNVGTGVGHTVIELIEIVSRLTDTPLTVERVPNRGFDVRKVVLAVEVLSSLVDWDPVPLEQGVRHTWRAGFVDKASVARAR